MASTRITVAGGVERSCIAAQAAAKIATDRIAADL